MGLTKKFLTFGIALVVGTGCITKNTKVAYLPIKYENKIRISDDSYAPAYYVSKKEIEKDLTELAKNSEREECWIYRVRNEEGVLIDIGREFENGTKTSGGILRNRYSIVSNTDEIESYLKKGDEVTFYHIHPSGWRTDGAELSFHPSNQDFYSQLPSLNDFYAANLFKNKLAGKGIRMNPSVVIGELLTVEYGINGYIPNVTEIVKNSEKKLWSRDKNIEEEIKDFKNDLNKKGIFIEITPKYPLDKLK